MLQISLHKTKSRWPFSVHLSVSHLPGEEVAQEPELCRPLHQLPSWPPSCLMVLLVIRLTLESCAIILGACKVRRGKMRMLYHHQRVDATQIFFFF